MKAICGLDCDAYDCRKECSGCGETGGRPFGGECILAACCRESGCENKGHCYEAFCRLKDRLIAEFNALEIPDMEPVTSLNALKGSYINLTYTLANGERVKLLEDEKVYLGNQLEKRGGDRCYGIAADETMLLVCEYGENGTDAEIVLYKRR